MDNSRDLYPSRTARSVEMFERLDPVVYGQVEDGPLEASELEAFDRDGFLFLDGFFQGEELDQLVAELHRMLADPPKDPQSVILEPGSQEVRSVFQVHDYSPRFSQLARDPRILNRVRQLLGSDVYIHQSRINYKPGFKGKGFNWHSDFETWHTEDGMPRMRAVSCSVILTENNEFNGPLMLIPGSHKFFVPCQGETPQDNYKQSLKVQEAGVPDNDSLAELIDLAGGIRAPKGPAGSVLLFDCNVLHGSNANMSPYPRSNVFFVYNSVKNTMQRPYAASQPRPGFLANHDYTPLTPAAG